MPSAPAYANSRIMPDHRPSIERLIARMIVLKATDLYIKAGKPPLLRVKGRICRLDTRVLEALDTEALVRSVTPENARREVKESGQAEFTLDFQGSRFRVTVFTEQGELGLQIQWASSSSGPVI
jgi:twitching motility protein PilT